MSLSQNSQYLESKVLTASPQRLHLMLIEGAQRFGRQAEEALRRGDMEAAATQLLRVLDIVGELLAGVRAKKSELNTKLADFYWFLFRRVSLAKIHGDALPLAEVLKLLEFERQTWQLACDKLEGAPGLSAAVRAPHSFAPRGVETRLTLEA
ncbi:MAG: flagellar export chaperone FliS [Pirellulales bacterium]